MPKFKFASIGTTAEYLTGEPDRNWKIVNQNAKFSKIWSHAMEKLIQSKHSNNVDSQIE